MITDAEIQTALPALAPGNAAVITGAASGIGLAAAKRLALMGMKIVLADIGGARLDDASRAVSAIAGDDAVLAVAADVSKADEVHRLAERAFGAFGGVSLLMNNAGIGDNPGKPWENGDAWKRLLDINFWGVVHGVEAFAPRMLASASPGLIVNTGSKQGITTPPGNLAYNVSKAGVKTFTEGLSHALRNEPGAHVAAHLLIPGFTFTGLTEGATEKPAGAWTGEQVVDFMLESLTRGDFYILCPDNEAARPLDEKRMAWAIGDIIENRPALSRWHPDHKDSFAAFMKN
ncbi:MULTISPECIES: SDR family NAD(P)-dependent oxidoreductase [unclassified Mesorhizobium]|jgi:NAD(P)-dependent dehydrogenase (short-subunit alcohol dehydrogenase family)|uniref:SDR family NAD(P)-dependent oxidoreductase n=1 Tax=unclassified Mesorhizobium TaxID=325217 RepID=UPI000FCAF999|nr:MULTISPECIES: SDR family NAD(P)-dependent oxidoreductase [unclassified Mesorhizobium]RUV19572.1 SDR family NAD(P)-dependent oxidoreductase [Mesorhizobium sp. M7A.F.Ca.MR.245.00.0.0]RUV35512.1 SDR family NAD(P)-dependent oxidoreductase [Mesorhizobium sp. M7A.F.Ca.MR.148.00.0.0]RUV47261.1 SDR family NAD(P)-dependent oxidoreductase [Mesorhizobium sp. M7A.F.Ca.MR.228.00.0.0]RWN47892.1 MAG: SDR family NAD(P)-dependent oxidoreductase [Mesorhizobium sp.]